MKKSNIFLALVLLTVLLACKTKSVPSENKENTTVSKVQKPNILILHVDDLGFHDLSIHGSQIYQTPNIDALSKESVTFSNELMSN